MRTNVVFDGFNLSDAFDITDLSRPDSEFEAETQEVPGMDGTMLTGARLGTVTIEMTLTAIGKTKAERVEAMHALTALLNRTDDPRRLEFTDEGGLYRLAVPISGGSRKGYFNAESKHVVFLIPDPVLYGAERSATIPSGGSASIHIGGTYAAKPRITAAAAVRASNGLWGIRLDDGDYSNVSVPTSAASAVLIDAGTREVRVSGNPAMITLASDWLELTPGEHKLEMTQGTGAATVTWRERWL